MKRLLHWGGWIARLAIGGGLTFWIVRRLLSQPINFDTGNWTPLWPLWMGGGHLLFFGAYLLGIVRWRLLMDCHFIHLSWKRAFSIFFIGHFFNAFMLGATGGDMIKAWYAARETHHRKTEAATLVFLDRLVGLVGLVILVLAVLAFRVRFIRDQPSVSRATLFLVILLGATLLGLALLWRRNWLESAAWNRLSSRLPKRLSAQASRVYRAVFDFKNHPVALLHAFFLSLGVHILSLLACLCFAIALGVPLSIFHAFTLFPLLGALGSIPVTPGGYGFREGISVVLFGTIGIEPVPAFLISLFPHLSMLLWSLFGGLLYLAEPVRGRPALHEKPNE
jgi:uncharacterized protein (TIRG00374 family)